MILDIYEDISTYKTIFQQNIYCDWKRWKKKLKSGDYYNSSGKKYEYDGAFGKGQLCAIGKCERCALHKKMESKLQIIWKTMIVFFNLKNIFISYLQKHVSLTRIFL